jgi:hypothetical protein
MINEWVAFGIVAVICGLLAVLVRLSGDDAPDADESPDAAASQERVTRVPE